MSVGFDTEKHIIMSLHLKPLIYPQHYFIAMNLLPNELVYTSVYVLIRKYASTLFIYIRIPVRDI